MHAEHLVSVTLLLPWESPGPITSTYTLAEDFGKMLSLCLSILIKWPVITVCILEVKRMEGIDIEC